MNSLQEAFNSMSDTQKFGALFSDPLTGVYNRRAFELTDSPFLAIIDLDSLKWVNDNLGHRAGDTLLVAVAIALCNKGLEVYRLSGDEFAVRGNNYDDLFSHVRIVQQHLETISIGFGEDLETADEDLRKDKTRREQDGLRSPRGECPPWMKIRPVTFPIYGELSNG
jgi:GGDEF domain-containing protein